MATPANGILPLTGDILIDAMTTGYRWNSDGPIYYSFSDGFNDEVWNSPAFVSTQLQTIFANIDSYVAADFIYLGYFASPIDAAFVGSDINVSIDSVYISADAGDNTWAEGFFPNTLYAQNRLGDLYYDGAEGDIYININSLANSVGYGEGQAGYFLLLHEIGHTLGLKHPHDDGGTGSPTFVESGIEGLNIDWLTIMSYEDDYNWNLNAWDPATPMILDVIALQYLYGADTSTNSGNSVFNLASNTNAYRTLFDASGNDTINLANFQEGAHVELPKYVLSEDQYAPFGLVTTLTDWNLAGSPHSLTWILGTIENVVGSPFGDEIVGSGSAENISAGGGFDQIFVGLGDDTVDGGAGSDWVYFLAQFADCQISFEGNTCIVESALDGRNTLTDVETLIFDHEGTEDFRDVAMLALAANVPPLPQPSDWQLLASNGQLFGVGGRGRVFGTTGYQDVLVLDFEGIVTFDSSFNKGGDIVTLQGNADDWLAARVGSQAILYNGTTFVQIPVGTAGMVLDFDDGARTLRIDTGVGAIKIGSFIVGTEFTQVNAPPEIVQLPVGYDPSASGRVIISQGGEVIVGGDFQIFGTVGQEKVTFLLGNTTLDASFNKGGDLLLLTGNATEFEASTVGSLAVLDGGFDGNTHVRLPVGVVGMDISFFDGVRTLYIDTDVGAAFVGEQQIGPTPVGLIA